MGSTIGAVFHRGGELSHREFLLPSKEPSSPSEAKVGQQRREDHEGLVQGASVRSFPEGSITGRARSVNLGRRSPGPAGASLQHFSPGLKPALERESNYTGRTTIPQRRVFPSPVSFIREPGRGGEAGAKRTSPYSRHPGWAAAAGGPGGRRRQSAGLGGTHVRQKDLLSNSRWTVKTRRPVRKYRDVEAPPESAKSEVDKPLQFNDDQSRGRRAGLLGDDGVNLNSFWTGGTPRAYRELSRSSQTAALSNPTATLSRATGVQVLRDSCLSSTAQRRQRREGGNRG
ncbi:hypothetical protein SKAU_G00391560 [Synaphobranchus kaupii]|uniref:Uncharacterized protein n=1 Tax=Synaphobranchus kaupii TaxID=118154 RepID=A0A9Q1EBN3_SYNKA|nr:hypothetical protein SKAU_G00391560 [Synaphobranchus kaupii]